MAVQVYKFSGKAAYVSKNGKTFAPGEDPVFSMRLYPTTAADRAAIKNTGIKNKPQEDDGSKSGVPGFFYTFRSNEAYPIVDSQGSEITALVGNGSEVTVDLQVEHFTSPKFGPQARSKLLKVVVTKLIEYIPPDAQAADVPA